MVGHNFTGHVWKSSKSYTEMCTKAIWERNTELGGLLEFGMATNMVVCIATFSKRQSKLITYEKVRQGDEGSES